MDKAAFEIIGNVGSVEIKAIKGGKKLAVLSVATSERWKRDNGANGGDWAEKTLWHRVAVFPGPKVERIEAQVQKGTRVRLVGQVRPSSYDDAKGITRYTVEFVVGPFGDVEILARAKPREAEAPATEAAPPFRAKRGKTAAAGDVEATA
jgi:single-strand DNA-binding protein